MGRLAVFDCPGIELVGLPDGRRLVGPVGLELPTEGKPLLGDEPGPDEVGNPSCVPGICTKTTEAAAEPVEPLRNVNTVVVSGTEPLYVCVIVGRTTGAEDGPGAEEAPGFEEAPGTEDASGFEDAPGTDDAPGFEDTPGPEDAPGFEDAPGPDGAAEGPALPGTLTITAGTEPKPVDAAMNPVVVKAEMPE